MAYDQVRNYGPYAGPGPSYFQAFAGIRVLDQNATHVHIQVCGDIYVSRGDFYGTLANWSTSHNGSGQINLHGQGWYPNNPWVDIGWVGRGQTVSCWASGNYTGSRYYESSVSASWTIPTSGRAQTPSISVSPNIANYGQPVTVTAIRSPIDINARVWELQIEDGCRTRLVTTNRTTPNAQFASVPSTIMNNYGGRQGYYNACRYPYKKLGYVYYTVRQVHEWYGTYFYSDWVWAGVEVKSGVVTMYDASGAKKTGLVSIYDASGKVHPTLLSMYDSSGNVHETG